MHVVAEYQVEEVNNGNGCGFRVVQLKKQRLTDMPVAKKKHIVNYSTDMVEGCQNYKLRAEIRDVRNDKQRLINMGAKIMEGKPNKYHSGADVEVDASD